MDPSQARRTCKQIEINKALSALGFNTWSNLDPENTKGEKLSRTQVLQKLQQQMSTRMLEIEARRIQELNYERRLAKMPNSAKKKQLLYQQQQNALKAKKYHKTAYDEERSLHESYQILYREYERRNFKNQRSEQRRLNLSSTSSSKMSQSDSQTDEDGRKRSNRSETLTLQPDDDEDEDEEDEDVFVN